MPDIYFIVEYFGLKGRLASFLSDWLKYAIEEEDNDCMEDSMEQELKLFVVK